MEPTAVQHSPIAMTPAALRAIEALEAGGFEAWVVGGFVRDSLMERTVHDVDVATNAPWQQSAQCFRAAGFGVAETGTAHGTVTAIIDGEPVETTTYRTDGNYTDGRHPDSVSFVNSIDEDLARRDFTINAMAYHPTRGLYDPYGGRADIAAHTIRAVGNPQKRFNEDALRILRAARFSSELGYSIDPETAQAMSACKQRLDLIAQERICAEMQRLLCGAFVYMTLMHCADVICQVIPELEPLRGFDQKSPYHMYDIYRHSAYVTSFTPAKAHLRWAALLHDVGKPASFTIDPSGQGHFYGHAAPGEHIAKTVARRMKLPGKMTHDICLLVRHHDTQFPVTEKGVKRMVRKLESRPDIFYDLCSLKEADALAHSRNHRDRVVSAWRASRIMDDILERNEAFTLHDLALNGADVIACGIAPGPLVGQMLSDALDAVIDEQIPNDRDALITFVKSRMEH